ncbi:type II toxin-antitoxin system ParD family antitoxin [Sphingomonas endolithica]|uniref:type II toxin-antitoxin system ParD family antitoxin n=1 Tax=Sphingomonas endolithica TaxID=2972485 RepID=UPI0021AF2B85|nr:type II toxin-antitoxin system ParD family antitoxin [Sphingomonas sp. ZFBP2030]
MDVAIDARWEGFVQDAVRDGKFESASDVVNEGLRLVEEREAKLQALRDTLAASMARGGSYTSEEVRNRIASSLAERRTAKAS